MNTQPELLIHRITIPSGNNTSTQSVILCNPLKDDMPTWFEYWTKLKQRYFKLSQMRTTHLEQCCRYSKIPEHLCCQIDDIVFCEIGFALNCTLYWIIINNFVQVELTINHWANWISVMIVCVLSSFNMAYILWALIYAHGMVMKTEKCIWQKHIFNSTYLSNNFHLYTIFIIFPVQLKSTDNIWAFPLSSFSRSQCPVFKTE